MFTVKALPHVRLAIALRPLFDGYWSELRDAFLRAAVLARINHRVYVVALFHHASRTLGLQQRLLGSPFAHHLLYEIILW